MAILEAEPCGQWWYETNHLSMMIRCVNSVLEEAERIGVDLGFGYRFAAGAQLALDRGVAGAVAKIGDQVDAGVGRVDSTLLGPIGEAADVF